MYCKKCGKPITSIATECPYCHEKVIEDTPISNNSNNPIYNNESNRYNDIKRKSSIGSFIVIIGIIIAVIIIIKVLGDNTDSRKNYHSMTSQESQETTATDSPTYKPTISNKTNTAPSTNYNTTAPSTNYKTTTPSTNYNTTTTQNYQQIYNEYSQKLINAGPTSSINEMATILNEGVMKMAKYMYSAKGTDGQYATYQSWVNKLTEVYMNNCR